MKKAYLLIIFVFAVSLCTCVRAQAITLELNPATANQLTIAEGPDGTYTLRTTGVDPKIRTVALPADAYNPDSLYILSFEYLATAGLDGLQIFYGPPITGANSVTFGPLTNTGEFKTFRALLKIEAPTWEEAYTVFRMDFGLTPGQEITVRKLELRAPTPMEIIPITLDPETSNQLESVVENEDGSFTIVTGGSDPFIGSDSLERTYDPEEVYVLSFDYTSPSGIDPDLEIFYGFPYAGIRKAAYGALPATATVKTFTTVLRDDAPGWNASYDRFRFDLGRTPGQEITMSNILLRIPTNAEAVEQVVDETTVDTIAIELDVAATSGDLSATEVETGSYILNTSGGDPWIRSKVVTDRYDPDSTYILTYEYRSATAYNELQVFYGPPIAAVQSLVAPTALVAAPEWTTRVINTRLLTDNFQEAPWSVFRFDFGRNENVERTLEIRNIRLRKPTSAELQAELTSDKFVSREANADLLEYLATSYDNSVNRVTIDMETVSVEGVIGGDAGAYFLAEIEPQFYGFSFTNFVDPTPIVVTDGDFTFRVARYAARVDRDYDRLYSRWAVVIADGSGGYELASAMEWPTDIAYIAENNQEEDKATSIKGIDGLTPGSLRMFGDLIDLDVRSMKLNLLIQGIYADGPTGMSHEFNGKSYDVNPSFVGGLDDRIKMLTDNDIKSSLVFLIPLRSNNENIQRRFVHPDAYLGNYSMANVATEEGIEYYTAIIDFLAKRYSRPDSLYGHLDQWIIHNEVDAHTAWTHAGDKPVELYTQIYDRSMRMVYYTIRKHNPTAKVFGSFTKHWNSKAVSNINFRSRDVLNVLGQLSKKEGDYEWGIAWHSYPTNLANASVWNDPIGRTPLNLDAPEITPRNLEMIDAYVRQESVLYNGKKVRTVLLSENGFNSNPDNAGSSEGKQAAALAYFWKKAENKRLPSIENIQLHRWVDFPTEGGILFGLWTTKPGTIGVFDEKKDGWYVWEAAGTPREDSIFAPYLDTIGIADWPEIQFAVPTEVTPYPVDLRLVCNIGNVNNSLVLDPDTLLVEFNGEARIPQENGTARFYNVASDIVQAYRVYRNGLLVAEDSLRVDGPLSLVINSCATTATVAIDVDNDLKVYPNPTLGMLLVNLPAGFGQVTLSLVDMSGRTTPLTTRQRGQTIDLSRFAPGVYVLRALSEKGKLAVRKVVIR